MGANSVSRGSRPSGASGRERRSWLPLPCEAAGRFEDKGDIGGIESIDEPVEFVDLWRGTYAEPGCLSFEESLLLGFDDRGKVRLAMKMVDQETGKEITEEEAAE